MAEYTLVEWTDHTYNEWIGCFKKSPGCANCFAEVDSPARIARGQGRELWGKDAPRQVVSESTQRKPLAWNRKAEAEGVRRRVFAFSQGDWLEDRPDLLEPRARLFGMIRETPWLDWLLLTKRPESWRKVMRETAEAISKIDAGKQYLRVDLLDWLGGDFVPPNVWFGVSVESQEYADERIPLLLEIPAKVRFLSMEPLLGPVDVSPYLESVWCGEADPDSPGYTVPGLDWVIVGGESGRGARPCDLAWIRSIRDQCSAAGVAFFLKQLGARPEPPEWWDESTTPHTRRLIRHKKGGDPAEWPEDLRGCRAFPTVEV